MKKIIFILLFLPLSAGADAPATTCPVGYITIASDNVTQIATTCPMGYIAVGTAKSCLSDDYIGGCYMYAPAGMSYTDDTGTYEFTDACVMTD